VQKHPTLVCRHSRGYLQRVADGAGWAGVTAGLTPDPWRCCVSWHRPEGHLFLATCRIRTRPFVEGV